MMAQNTWDRFAFDCPYQIKAHAALRTIFEEKESTPFGDEQQPLTPADVSYSIFTVFAFWWNPVSKCAQAILCLAFY